MKYYEAVKKIKIMEKSSLWVELEQIVLSVITQTEKDKHYMSHLICR